jgi:CPA1 family monovalent cation:H+ antiporter
MWWGGLRGSIPIALLLLLSHIVHDGTALEGFSGIYFIPESVYEDMLVLGFSVVLFTLIVQGLTMKPMLNRLGITGVLSDSEARYEGALADVVGSRAALRRLSTLHMQGRISDEDHLKLAEPYREAMSAAESRVKDLSETSVVHASRVESARRDLLIAQIQALREAERDGTISSLVARKVLSSLEEALSESEFTRETIRATVPSPDDLEEEPADPPVPEDTESVIGVPLSELDEEE